MKYIDKLNLSKATAETLDMILDDIREFHKKNYYTPQHIDFWLSTEPAILNELLSQNIITPIENNDGLQYYRHKIDRNEFIKEFIGGQIEAVKETMQKIAAAKRAPLTRRNRRS